MTKYVTGFVRGAIDHWANHEAVREFAQNWSDSDGEQEFEIGEDFVCFTNKNIKVSNKMLLMGLSDKRDDPTKRGQYGTGSLMALCVLTSRGIAVSIQNNNVVWDARFEHSEQFDEDVMVIDETPYYPSNDFVVTISGLSEEDITDIRQTNLAFQNRDIIASSRYGDIMISDEGVGEVFVGELFVQQTSGFNYSYNIKPEFLKLNQDRQSCSEWDLQTITAKLIMSCGDNDLIKEAIDSNKLDTQHVKWSTSIPDEVSDDYATEFIKEHEGSLVTSDYSTHQENEEHKVPSVYIPNSVQVKAIEESSLYQESIEDVEVVEKLSVDEYLEKYTEELYSILERCMTNEDLVAVRELTAALAEVAYKNWSGDSPELPF